MSATFRAHYPADASWRDGIRAAVGLAVTLTPPLITPMAPVMTALFAIAAATFAGYGLRALWRRRLTLEVGSDGVVIHRPGRPAARLAWDRLTRFKLARYAVGSVDGDRPEIGWSELRLGAEDGARLTVESSLIGYDRLVALARAAAARRDLPLSPATRANLGEIAR